MVGLGVVTHDDDHLTPAGALDLALAGVCPVHVIEDPLLAMVDETFNRATSVRWRSSLRVQRVQ